MNTLLLLAMMPFLSAPYTSSDILIQDTVYHRVRDYEHKIAWNGSSSRRLKQLKVIKIIDYENNLAWLIDESNGRIVREDIYLKEQSELQELTRQNENAERLVDERIAKALGEGGIHITADGRVIRGLPKPVTDNRSYTVQFAVSDDNASKSILDEIGAIFSKEDNLSVIGFASPDGENPDMQMSLAYRRLSRVSAILESVGYKVTEKLGVVCGSDIDRSKCWKVEITINRGNR